MRIAVLDIGTNTVLLLIADVEGNSVRAVQDIHAIARLGEGVDRTHRISEAAYDRFVTILQAHKKTIQDLKCDRTIAVATSAMRDAENRDDIIRRARRDTGIEIEILSGDDEARFTYHGAILGMQLVGNIGVVDIGGGSTEISTGTAEAFESGVSLDIGAVRITERYFSSNPITQASREAAQAFIQQSLRNIPNNLPTSCTLVAVAGTPSTLAAMHQNLPAFDAASVYGYVLHRENIENMLDILFRVSTSELLERFPSVNKSRADILPAGTLILAEVMDYLGAEHIMVSTQGLRYGIAIRSPCRTGF